MHTIIHKANYKVRQKSQHLKTLYWVHKHFIFFVVTWFIDSCDLAVCRPTIQYLCMFLSFSLNFIVCSCKVCCYDYVWSFHGTSRLISVLFMFTRHKFHKYSITISVVTNWWHQTVKSGCKLTLSFCFEYLQIASVSFSLVCVSFWISVCYSYGNIVQVHLYEAAFGEKVCHSTQWLPLYHKHICGIYKIFF